MSNFIDSVFIIIEDSAITSQMVNLSTSRSKQMMPSKLSGIVLMRILETQVPVSSIFATYTWYKIDNISAAWEAIV